MESQIQKTDPIRTIYAKLRSDAQLDATPYVRDHLRASEAGHCQRQIGYSLLGFKPQASSLYSLRVRNSGDLHHKAVRDLFRKCGVEIYNEEETYRATLVEGNDKSPSINLKARIDGRLRVSGGRFGDAENFALLEVKSFSIFFKRNFEKAYAEEAEIDTAGFAWPKSGAWSAGLVWRDYALQTQIALFATGLQYAYLAPVFRDSGWLGIQGRGLVIPRDAAAIEAVKTRLARIYLAALQKELLDPEFQPQSRECSFCQFWQHCWGSSLGIKQIKKNADDELLGD